MNSAMWMSVALLLVPLVAQLVSCRNFGGTSRRTVKYPQPYARVKDERTTGLKTGGISYSKGFEEKSPARFSKDQKSEVEITTREGRLRAAKLVNRKPEDAAGKAFPKKRAEVSKNGKPRSSARQTSDIVEVVAVEAPNTIATANFPQNYPDSYEDEWLLEVEAGLVVAATFHVLDIEYHTGCDWDSLTLYDGATSFADLLAVFCGTLDPETTINSSGRFMYLVFSSDYIINGAGFQLTYFGIHPDAIEQDPVSVITDQACSISSPALVAATGEPGMIQSPGGLVGSYPNFAYCTWRITASDDRRIYLRFMAFSVEYAQDCVYDRLAIYEGLDDSAPVRGTFCGYFEPYDIVSYGRYFYLEFESDEIVASSGFTIEYHDTVLYPDDLSTNACPGPVHLEGSGELTSVGFDEGQYHNDQSCSWEVAATPGMYIRLAFLEFKLEFHPACAYDVLAIYDGANSDAPEVDALCGHNVPNDIVSTTHQVFLHFRSDYSVTDVGFRIEYSESEVSGSLSNSDLACPGPLAVTTGDVIETPGYDMALYPNSEECHWDVTVPTDMYAVVEFLDFDIEPAPSCIYDFVKVTYGQPPDDVVMALVCGSDLPNNVSSPTNQLHVTFQSDYTVRARGFLMLVHESATPGRPLDDQPACPGPHPVDAEGGYIVSSGYHIGGYSNYEECSWRVTAPEFSFVHLEFVTMGIEESSDCIFDRLVVHNGFDDTAPSITYCGTTLPADFTSTGNVVFVTFTSDWLVTGAGFYILTSVSNTAGDAIQEACPGPVYVTELTSTEIMSPFFGSQNYPNSAECSWRVAASDGYYVHLHFVAFDLEYSLGCSSDSLRIYDWLFETDLLRAQLCGDQLVDDMTSISNKFLLTLTSNAAISFPGFKIQATAIDTPGTLPDAPLGDRCPGPQFFGQQVPAGVIETVHFGTENYTNNAICSWMIQGTENERIHLHFTDFSVEDHIFCAYDHLVVYDGNDTQGAIPNVFCGRDLPPDMTSTTNTTILVFFSDDSVNDLGFRAEFQKFPSDGQPPLPAAYGQGGTGTNSSLPVARIPAPLSRSGTLSSRLNKPYQRRLKAVLDNETKRRRAPVR